MALSEFQKKSKAGCIIECIKNDGKLHLEITLDCQEFTWNCPAIQQPDFGTIKIIYTPNRKIIETKSLKMYLQQFRYKNAFNEELSHRILCDLLYYVDPLKIEVRLMQNSRGGIANTSTVKFDICNEKDVEAWKLTNYTPKRTFQGGWGMVKEK